MGITCIAEESLCNTIYKNRRCLGVRMESEDCADERRNRHPRDIRKDLNKER